MLFISRNSLLKLPFFIEMFVPMIPRGEYNGAPFHGSFLLASHSSPRNRSLLSWVQEIPSPTVLLIVPEKLPKWSSRHFNRAIEKGRVVIFSTSLIIISLYLVHHCSGHSRVSDFLVDVALLVTIDRSFMRNNACVLRARSSKAGRLVPGLLEETPCV